MFFPGAPGRRQQSNSPSKAPSVKQNFSVSLEDLYNGKTVKLNITRKVIDGQPVTCSECDGRGMRVQIRQLTPGMIQQMQSMPKMQWSRNILSTKTTIYYCYYQYRKGSFEGDVIKLAEMATR